MSRIFEGLLLAESERSGLPLSDLPSSVAELLQTEESKTNGLEQFRSVRPSFSEDSRMVCMTNLGSLAAEKFRALSVRMKHVRQSRGLKKLLVTSTLAEEGKSMVAANLALTLARPKLQNVLLLEGDLRQPLLAQRFGLGPLPGLSEWLKSEAPLATAIYHLEGTGIWFMPAGAPPENPLELMQSGRLSTLFDSLTTLFDWIVLDSPPMIPLADTSLLSRLADGILLVAREGKTEKLQLRKGLEMLDSASLVGVVLNSSSSTDDGGYHQY